MPEYKLTYFDIRGRGEIVRLMFALADVEYEDVRLKEEQWATVKPTSPFGQLPMFETEGVTLCQSNAIARYLARKFGFAGKTDLEQARADMLVDCMEDMGKPLIDIFVADTDEKKAELTKKAREELYPASMQKLEAILTQNNGGDGWFVGDDITWADVALFQSYSWTTLFKLGDMMAKTPKLKALHDRVANHTRIAAYVAKRPESAM